MCGVNENGKLGDGTKTDRLTPTQIQIGVRSVASPHFPGHIIMQMLPCPHSRFSAMPLPRQRMPHLLRLSAQAVPCPEAIRSGNGFRLWDCRGAVDPIDKQYQNHEPVQKNPLPFPCHIRYRFRYTLQTHPLLCSPRWREYSHKPGRCSF